jgi:hypothetical protein
MKWFYRIVARLCGCRHRWKILSRTPITRRDATVAGEEILSQCDRCGRVRQDVFTV